MQRVLLVHVIMLFPYVTFIFHDVLDGFCTQSNITMYFLAWWLRVRKGNQLMLVTIRKPGYLPCLGMDSHYINGKSVDSQAEPSGHKQLVPMVDHSQLSFPKSDRLT